MTIRNTLLQKASRRITCEICQAVCRGNIPLCAGCHDQLPWNHHPCRSCGEPLPATHSLCGRCQQSPLPFAHVVIPFRYSFPVNQWIGAYKYREMPGMVQWLAALLSDHVLRSKQQSPTLVLGVPMHPKQQRKRGYNQSLLLARQLALLQQVAFNDSLLIKTQSTQHQRGLNAAARRHNLQNAFSVIDEGNTLSAQGRDWLRVQSERIIRIFATDKGAAHRVTNATGARTVKNQHIALVDDVVTTGATSAEIAQRLLDAGALSISLWALAKTPLHNPATDSGSHIFLDR